MMNNPSPQSNTPLISPPSHECFAHVVVAAVIHREGKYLLVREHTDQGIRINQPAGHWERHETLIQAIEREVKEETGYAFTPKGILGIFTYLAPRPAPEGTLYLRFAIVGEVGDEPVSSNLDREIIAAEWWSEDDIRSHAEIMRSPMVLAMVERLKTTTIMPLSILHDFRWSP